MKKELLKLNELSKKYNVKTLACDCFCYCTNRKNIDSSGLMVKISHSRRR